VAWISVLSTTGVTAYVGMHDIGRVRAGSSVLVSASTGGVGGVAVQLARAAGARVVATAGGRQRTDHARQVLGADVAVDCPQRLYPIRAELAALLRAKRLRAVVGEFNGLERASEALATVFDRGSPYAGRRFVRISEG
jgi:NADPH:quinone reductase-like Zn-dependent oxidoreductase